MKIYPLKFYPIFKERLWGGEKLRTVLGKDVKGDRIGESWEISGVSGDVSVVCNGPLKGKNLNELIAAEPEALLGKSVLERFGKEFPILIKFIDAARDLSIQVHPDDTLARQRHNSFGKTEMWYIMDADPGSQLIIGFEEDTTPGKYREALDAGDLTKLLHYQPVAAGEGYFINSGKIHAIGGGILLAEIQQTSDITYRVFDFNRKDADGKLRELHTEQAVDAIDYSRKDDFVLSYQQKPGQANPMAVSQYFTTAYLEVAGNLKRQLEDREAFTILIAVEGEAAIQTGSEKVNIKRGESVLIPAAADRVDIQADSCKLLEVTI
ncbi:type I phosphomannose isomerase catalytic subunit [Robiginitalea sp. IMCC44478]|uniref:type I phosphomannose isomerase catalytic subunit n=1 Tax=Robiginitalea sp. IMCC44478 TaxID=3459122 RepID=UPI00404267AB